MKKFRYGVEAVILYLFYYFCAVLKAETASNMGGWLGRTVGPHLAASRKARENIRRAFPEKSAEEVENILIEMWDNLGRILAEYPHLKYITQKNLTLHHADIAEDMVKAGAGGVFISGHFSNWEVMMPAMLVHLQVTPHLTYRAANNPWADRLLAKARNFNGQIKTFPKHRSSAKDLTKALKNNNYIGILIDQKYNEGVAVPFLGHPAMTNPVAVVLCQKYKKPLVVAVNKRLGPARFEMTLFPPLHLFDQHGQGLPVETVLLSAHKIFEEFILENPGQWLWLHRRWNSKIFSQES